MGILGFIEKRLESSENKKKAEIKRKSDKDKDFRKKYKRVAVLSDSFKASAKAGIQKAKESTTKYLKEEAKRQKKAKPKSRSRQPKQPEFNIWG